MKTHIYKVFGFDPDDEPTGWDAIESVQVMTQEDLRKEFLWAYNSGHIAHDIISDYMQDPDYKEERWDDIGGLRVGTMIDIMNDLINYNAPYCYYIHETDIDIDITDPVHHATLLATLHKDAHPDKQNSEVINTVENYLKDNGEM